ncbi:prophage antirepressor [Thiovulum sp. ES]|nr:prophage antirepressor [Thiovulum sp. ES]
MNIISKENILNFDFHSNNISVFLDENGGIWFIAKQISDILGYSRTNKMVERLDDDENKTIPRKSASFIPDEFFGNQGLLSIINEWGLYTSILGSKLPNAKDFKKWVTREVLPEIRKTGSYSIEKKIETEKLTPQKSLEIVEVGIQILTIESNRTN